MFSWTILIWMLIGAFAGVATRKLIGGDPPFGMVGDVVLGTVGGAVGGVLIAIAGGAASLVWLIGSVMTAVLGGALLIWLASIFTPKHS